MIFDVTNLWQLPILYDLETDRIVHNSTMMTDEIFQANRPKEILLTEEQIVNSILNEFPQDTEKKTMTEINTELQIK